MSPGVAPSARFGYVPRNVSSGRRTPLLNSPQDEIVRYLRTGESDMLSAAWPGDSFITRAQNGDQALRNALIAEVLKRTPYSEIPEQLVNLNVAAFAEDKIAPMVRGLLPSGEQPVAMEMFRRSIVFLAPDNIAAVILKTPFASTAWDLANLYLLSCGAEPLSKGASEIVGLSEETTCYISTAYFRSENRLDDFVVHEAAHVFHNCKRETIGLPRIRGREWLLEIDFRKRELFAYACEVYSCIVALNTALTSRKAPQESPHFDRHITAASLAVTLWDALCCSSPAASLPRAIQSTCPDRGQRTVTGRHSISTALES